MSTMTRTFAAAALTGLLLVGTRAHAIDPPVTTITIPEMDCASCAKKVGGKVAEVIGVDKVEYDVKARILKVTHKVGTSTHRKPCGKRSNTVVKIRVDSKVHREHTPRNRRIETVQ